MESPLTSRVYTVHIAIYGYFKSIAQIKITAFPMNCCCYDHSTVAKLSIPLRLHFFFSFCYHSRIDAVVVVLINIISIEI